MGEHVQAPAIETPDSHTCPVSHPCLSSLSPGSWLWGEGQGARTAEDQQGRGSLPWERLQRQVPGPHQESPPPAPPGQEAQRADQPEKEQKERQGEMKVLVTSLRQPRSFLGLTAQATNTKDALKGGAEPQRERGARSGWQTAWSQHAVDC